MTDIYHDRLPHGSRADAAILNGPLDQLDAAIAAVIATGSGASTTLTAQALAGQPSLTVASSASFAIGQSIFVGKSGGTNESKIIDAIPDATHITLSVNLANTYASGDPVTASPIEIVDARGGLATLAARFSAIETRIFDVKRYGATGDGVTDDTTAINNAITAAAVAGGLVWFGAGTFVISSTLVIPAGVSLAGLGRTSLLFLANGSNCVMIRFPAGEEDGFYGTLRQFFRDIGLDGNKANQGAGAWKGIEFEDDATPSNSMLVMENVWVQFTKGAGVYIGEGRVGMTFKRVVAWGTDANGIEVHTSDVTLEACSGGQNIINLLLNNWGCHVMGGAWFAATGIASIHLTGLARYCHVIEAGIDRNAERGVYIEGEYNQVMGCRLGWNSDSAADTYDHIEVSTPKLGNVVRDNIALNQGTRSRALLSVGGASVGIYGPNIVEPGAALYEAFSPVPVKMAVRPRASVWRNSVDLSVPSGGGGTSVPFTTVREDSHGLWSAGAADRFAIPANRGLSGRYRIEALLQFAANATGSRMGELSTAAAIIARTRVTNAGAADPTVISVSREIYLNDGDVVALAANQTSGGNLDIVATNAFGCEFTATRLED